MKMKLIESLVRELLNEGDTGRWYPSDTLFTEIGNQLRRTGIASINKTGIPGFSALMKEIAIMESGQKRDGKIMHDNEQEWPYRGVFQMGAAALETLRGDRVVPKTKAKWSKNANATKIWEKQTDEDVFGAVDMQTAAACMYCLYLYYEIAEKPSLSSTEDRAAFWKTYYNTSSDLNSTAQTYIDKIEEYEAKHSLVIN